MKKGKNNLIAVMSSGLMVVALGFHPPFAVRASATGGLKPEAASLDVAQSSNQATTTSFPETTLYGGVTKHQESLDEVGANSTLEHPPQDLSAADNALAPQSEKAVQDAYTLADNKLSTGQRLSADEYRALGVGCTGFESVRTFFQDIANVTAVYPGSPADLAGIRKGDRMVCHDNDDEARANPTQPLWQVKVGRVGTPVDVTLLRHGQTVRLTLIRMNVEDIQDTKARRTWEQVICRLGYPTEGTFTGTSLHNLSQGE